MFDVFVSYRTADDPFGAEFVYEKLARRLGPERVFLDHVAIEAGNRFPQRLEAALDEVRVLVVVIGPRWLSRDLAGRRLIDREDDWVRREIRRAVERDITIIPVVLDGASLPGIGELPDDIGHLSRCQAAEVRRRHVRADLARLGDDIARTIGLKRRVWRAAGLISMIISMACVVGDSIHPEPVTQSVLGDPRTADPCELISPALFSGYGNTELDRAYGNFERCDLIISPDNGPPVDLEVHLDEGPLEEGAVPAKWVGEIGIVEWAGESDGCERALTLPPGDGGSIVMIQAEVDDEPNTVPLCAVADSAADAAAGILAEAHDSGGRLGRRSFPPESLANLDACLLLDGDELARVIPGVDATEPEVGYGNWSCAWSSSSDDLHAKLRFDQSVPLDGDDGQPTRIGGLEAFVTPELEGTDSCTVRVVRRSYPGQHGQVVELLQLTVDEGEDEDLPVCRMAADLAAAAVDMPANAR